MFEGLSEKIYEMSHADVSAKQEKQAKKPVEESKKNVRQTLESRKQAKEAKVNERNFSSAAEFVQYLEDTLIPDLRASGNDATADDFEEAIEWLQAAGGGNEPDDHISDATDVKYPNDEPQVESKKK